MNFHVSAFVALILLIPTTSFAEVKPILFPVAGEYSFRNDYAEPRSGGARSHEGIDIIAAKMTPVIAVVDGTIRFIAIPQAPWGYSITLVGEDRYSYRYLHMNNDTPGTDDGLGGEKYAYAEGLREGSKVVAGQVLGWVGDSGNAESTISHLHFEIHDQSRNPVNPYDSLYAASGGKGTGSFETPIVTHTPEVSIEDEEQFVIRRQLKEGMVDTQVGTLHAQLKTLGYYKGDVNEVYTAATREAVRAFQVAEGIPPTGIADGLTQKRAEERAEKAPVASSPAAAVSAQLSEGAEGDAVRQMQLQLKAAGFFTGDATGYFGPITRSAVLAFQRANGIPAIGIVGPQTRAALAAYATPAQTSSSSNSSYVFKSNLAVGSRGDEVQALQILLKERGFFTAQATGYYGPLTSAAVSAFQRAEGIEPLGIVGPKTRAALNAKE